MATLQKGHTFANIDVLTPTKLNNLVDLAQLSNVVNADISTTAAIAHSKLATLPGGAMIVGSSTNVPTARTISGDVTVSNTGATTIQPNAITESKIADDAITNAKLRNSAALSVIGNSANVSINPGDITAGTDGHVLRRSGTTLGFGTIATAGITDDAVTFAKLQNSATAGMSVVGRSANSSGDFSEIAAGTDGHVLRRSGTTLGFGTIATAGITDNAVTFAKLQNSATAGMSVVGRSANSSGDFSEIAAGTDGHVLRRSGTTLGFGTISIEALSSIIVNALCPVGSVQAFARNSPPLGWLAANGNTIGSALSGAQNAGLDYEQLFLLLWGNGWTNTNLPIFTSSGSSSTRGVNAAADWAANKRISLPDLRGIFVRGSGAQTISEITYTGTFAAKQQDAFQGHRHSITHNAEKTEGLYTGAYSHPAGIQDVTKKATITVNDATTDTMNGTPRTASETRPANIALLYCIKF